MSVAIHFTLLGDDLFRHDVEIIGHRAGNMSPVLKDIRDMWITWTEEQFATEGARSLHPWSPLMRSTILRRGSAHPILIREANLLLEATDEDNFLVTDSFLAFHASDEVEEYGRFHQSGTSKMVARPIFEWTVWDRLHMMDALEDFLLHGRVP